MEKVWEFTETNLKSNSDSTCVFYCFAYWSARNLNHMGQILKSHIFFFPMNWSVYSGMSPAQLGQKNRLILRRLILIPPWIYIPLGTCYINWTQWLKSPDFISILLYLTCGVTAFIFPIHASGFCLANIPYFFLLIPTLFVVFITPVLCN